MAALPLLLLTAAALSLTPQLVLANHGGIVFRSGRQGTTCVACHSGAGQTPNVSFEGPSVLVAGETGDFVFTVQSNQTSQRAAGFNVATDGGTLIIVPNQGARLLSGELTHTAPKSNDASNRASWSFRWEAPVTPGSYTFWGAGNSVNLNGSTTGDRSSTTTAMIVVAGAPAATFTPTSTPLPSQTPTRTATTAPTATPSSTPTLSPTPQPTHSATAIHTAVPSLTSTPTRTPSDTATASPSSTPTTTRTSTAPATPSASASTTHTPTATSTPLFSPTLTPRSLASQTPSASAAPTATDTYTPSAASHPSETPTVIPSHTAFPSPSSTPTASATVTPASRPTPSPIAGDANCDERVSAADLPALFLLLSLDQPARCGADADGNGVLDAGDIEAVIARLYSRTPPSPLYASPQSLDRPFLGAVMDRSDRICSTSRLAAST